MFRFLWNYLQSVLNTPFSIVFPIYNVVHCVHWIVCVCVLCVCMLVLNERKRISNYFVRWMICFFSGFMVFFGKKSFVSFAPESNNHSSYNIEHTLIYNFCSANLKIKSKQIRFALLFLFPTHVFLIHSHWLEILLFITFSLLYFDIFFLLNFIL